MLTYSEMLKIIKGLEDEPAELTEIILPKKLEDMIVEMTVTNYLHYNALPWYRKLIYKWNMRGDV